MTRTFFYLSHPDVLIDPAVPVPRWPLNDTGRARATRAATLPQLRSVTRIIASTEQKAIDTAQIIAEPKGLSIATHPDMGENDRSATGFLPPDEFQATANAFFANPDQSIRGWETATGAQSRIRTAVTPYTQDDHPGDTLFIGHGGVGTLLWCAIAGLSISREYDQPGTSGGNLFAFNAALEPLWPWRAIEELAP